MPDCVLSVTQLQAAVPYCKLQYKDVMNDPERVTIKRNVHHPVERDTSIKIEPILNRHKNLRAAVVRSGALMGYTRFVQFVPSKCAIKR